ncbi:MAG: nucleoside-diphosphate sugar epimerase, partial [Bacteroidetes bacterium QH_10_64_19]
IQRLAERVRALVGTDVEVTNVPYEEVYGEGFEDMDRRVPDLSKLEAATGYEPRHGMDEILRDVIEQVRAGEGGVPASAPERVNGSA